MCPALGSRPAARTATPHRATPHSSCQGASCHSQLCSGCLPSLPLQAPSTGLWGERLLSPGLTERGSQTRVEATADLGATLPAPRLPGQRLPLPAATRAPPPSGSKSGAFLQTQQHRSLPGPHYFPCGTRHDGTRLIGSLVYCRSAPCECSSGGLSPQLLRVSGEPRKGRRQTPLPHQR